MSWNYRVTRQRFAEGTDAAEMLYAIREVYYTDDGQVRSWTAQIIGARGDTVAECRADHALMQAAFALPVLDITDEANPFEVREDEAAAAATGPTPERPAEETVNIDTLRGIVRMSALVVMDEVGATDKALATAIAAKASIGLREHLNGLLDPTGPTASGT